MAKILNMMKEIGSTFFVGGSIEKLFELVCDDIYICGFADNTVIENIEQAAEFWKQKPYQKYEGSLLYFGKERQLSDHMAVLEFDLEYKKIRVGYRVTGVSKDTSDGEKIASLHISAREPVKIKQMIEYRAKEVREQLLDETTAGGMMGGYIEPGFPFYFINKRMLIYLGYESESEFVDDIQGLIDNCMHPEDREYVGKETISQIEKSGEYQVEYRMRKKDGSYIWVHDLGRKMTAEDGRDAITSVCYDITEQIHMRDEVLQNQEMLELAYDFADMWNWLYDIPNDRIFPGKRLQKDFDMPEVLTDFPESWLSMGFIMPESVPLHRERVQAIKEGSVKEEFVCKIRHRDNSIHWTRIRFNRMSGNTNHAICTAQLIDTEKYLESRIELEERQQQEGKPNLLAHFVTNLSKNEPLKHVYHYEERKNLLEWNSLQEQLERTEKYIINPEDREKFVRSHDTGYLLNQFVQGNMEEIIEYRREFPDEKIIWVRSVIHMLQEPTTGDILNYEYLYNIHEYKTNEELMSAVVNFGFEICASLIVDSNQITVLYSKRQHGEDNLVVSQYTELNTKYADKIIEEDREQYLQESSIENIRKKLVKSSHFETIHRTIEDGVIHYKKDQCYGYSDDKAVCLLIRSDITELIEQEERKRIELKKALETAEKADMAKTEFLARMSHEIRTPMNAIMGMVSIARDNTADLQQIFDCLNKIDTSSHYLLNLINDILEMSRIESGKVDISHSEFDYYVLMENIRTIVEPLALESGIHYQYVSDMAPDTHYRGDMMRIQQILVNILTNAVKFTKANGRIRFTAKILKEDSKQSVFEFIIEDTGIGMSPKFMKHMFEPFVQENIGNTSKYAGTGLGLSISKNLVETMGGSIAADSFEGLGSTFTITIPLERINNHIEEAYHLEEAKTENKVNMLEGYQILMAEDHPLNTMVARKLLESRGAVVTVAENGQIAVDIFDESEPGFFDAILMDIRMPVMDGLDATRTIRSMKRLDARTIPIIAMTANALDEDRRKTKDAGMNAHLAKPFEPMQLFQTLVEHISGERYL
ncbi:MAG: ATP-binding protein [Lachnospiraceae bacterium]|nr:ATP-binding protein [Lachnospiraceae bacterium]